jgi:hypothetical protein
MRAKAERRALAANPTREVVAQKHPLPNSLIQAPAVFLDFYPIRGPNKQTTDCDNTDIGVHL